MYVKKKWNVIVWVNVWFKDWEFWSLVEYFDGKYVKKLFMQWEEQIEKFFDIKLTKNLEELKKIRRLLKEKYVKTDLLCVEVFTLNEWDLEWLDVGSDTE